MNFVILTAFLSGCLSVASQPATAPAVEPTVHAVVFDFACPDAVPGARLADSVRLRLRRDERFDVLDRLSTQAASGPVPANTDTGKVTGLMARLASDLAVYGTVSIDGEAVRAEVAFIDTSGPAPRRWKKRFADDTARGRAIIAAAIVEEIRGQAGWIPPQYGDQAEPTNFARPLNANGSFEAGLAGWDVPDGLSTFIEVGPKGRGRVLRIRTDLQRDGWLAYRRALLLGRTDPSDPPKVPTDTSYSSVAGLEGVHFNSRWIKATPGRRYWLVADARAPGGKPKVFVKGFAKTPAAMDGLPERSMVELGLTPEKFAEMPLARRKQLIATDRHKHPMRYLRECYRWHLNLRDSRGKWTHYAAPFPPRGGLPANVEWLQIQVYAYWPPGEYFFNNVHMYADPAQKAPLPEAKPRTPNFRKTQPGRGGASTRPSDKADQ